MGVRLRADPPGDREFLVFAEVALGVLPDPPTPAALQRGLRLRYPAATVTPDEDAGPPTWLIRRTAEHGDADAPSVPGRTSAWAILDDDRRFLEVGPGLARIAELPARAMVGQRIEDFSNPADPTIRDDIGRLWTEFQARGALVSTLRFNYADGRPRELAYRLEADADGPGRHRLTVTVVKPDG